MLTVDFDAKAIELLKNIDDDTALVNAFSESLVLLTDAMYYRATEEIDDSQLIDAVYYASLVLGLTLAGMGIEAGGLSQDFKERTEKLEALISE